jgi:hypothetical protein
MWRFWIVCRGWRWWKDGIGKGRKRSAPRKEEDKFGSGVRIYNTSRRLSRLFLVSGVI